MPPGARYPFRCPNAQIGVPGRTASGDDVDHLLVRVIDPDRLPPTTALRRDFSSSETNPFIKYRRLLGSYHSALANGLTDEQFVDLVRGLDGAVAGVDGRGFSQTPFQPCSGLARELGVSQCWVKDETGNVSGSHKARHLMGLMIWLEVDRALGGTDEPRPLAIASCGNAALAAAVVARAADRPLRVFIPEHADPAVVTELDRLGADLVQCVREPGVAGDPSFLRFREAVARGALPFTCQGPENGLVIEGGETLAFEMISVLIEEGRELDRMVIQVGGGALTTAVVRGFEEARFLGLIRRVPRVCTVQTEGAAPLARAYELVVERVAGRVGGAERRPTGGAPRAEWLRRSVPTTVVEEALEFAATHRSEFMWPWEREPRSVATGILDDETYDWLAAVRAMLLTGGIPLVVGEKTLLEANALATEATGIAVDPTGSAGLAGYLALQASDDLQEDEKVAVLFTGVSR